MKNRYNKLEKYLSTLLFGIDVVHYAKVGSEHISRYATHEENEYLIANYKDTIQVSNDTEIIFEMNEQYNDNYENIMFMDPLYSVNITYKIYSRTEQNDLQLCTDMSSLIYQPNLSTESCLETYFDYVEQMIFEYNILSANNENIEYLKDMLCILHILQQKYGSSIPDGNVLMITIETNESKEIHSKLYTLD